MKICDLFQRNLKLKWPLGKDCEVYRLTNRESRKAGVFVMPSSHLSPGSLIFGVIEEYALF